MLQALSGPTACWAGLLCIPCWVGLLCVPHGCSGRRRARPPARLGNLTTFGAAPRSPPVPSGPSGALHTGGASARTLYVHNATCSGLVPLRSSPTLT